MPTIGEDGIERMQRDHEHMLQLIDRIRSECTERGTATNCTGCSGIRQGVCHGNIEQLIRSFVETTMKHIMIESMLMEDRVPPAHRIAHNQAHTDIALQLKAIRVEFSEDHNAVLAIHGIDDVHQTLLTHFKEHDKQLEAYLTEPAAATHPQPV
jgi:hemerythrin